MAGNNLEFIIQARDNASKTLERTSRSLAAVGKSAAVAGAAVTALAAISIHSFASAGDEVQKMALRTGFSVEELSRLKFAAEQSGTSLAGLETGVRTMQKRMLDADAGSPPPPTPWTSWGSLSSS